MGRMPAASLTDREAEIMEQLWKLGTATSEQIRAKLPGESHDSTIRTMLRILEEKGFVSHRRDGRSFVFQPLVPRDKVQSKTLQEFVTLARKKGADWYLGGITNWDSREVSIPLEFLGPGEYTAEIYSDAPDADVNPKHTTIEQRQTGESRLARLLRLAEAGEVPALVGGRGQQDEPERRRPQGHHV